jgi:hypothetical protein
MVHMDTPQSRIEQLRRSHHRMTNGNKGAVQTPTHISSQEVDEQNDTAENVDDENYQSDNDVQARIDALRQERTEISRTIHNDLRNGDIQDVAPDSDKLDDQITDRRMEMQQLSHEAIQASEGRIEMLDLDKANPLSDVKDFREPAEYHVDGFTEPPAYPMEGFNEPAAYPIEVFQEPPAYPFEDFHEPAAYPVDDLEESPEYPVDDFQEPTNAFSRRRSGTRCRRFSGDPESSHCFSEGWKC